MSCHFSFSEEWRTDWGDVFFELFTADRLGEVSVHTRVGTLLLEAVWGVGGEGRYGCGCLPVPSGGESKVFLDLGCCLETVHDGHVTVHEDDAVVFVSQRVPADAGVRLNLAISLLDLVERFQAVQCFVRLQVEIVVKNCLQSHYVKDVVIHSQNWRSLIARARDTGFDSANNGCVVQVAVCESLDEVGPKRVGIEVFEEGRSLDVWECKIVRWHNGPVNGRAV